LGIVALLTTAPLIDRYLITIIPVALALCFKAGEDLKLKLPRCALLSSVAVGALALVGFIYTDTSLVVDGAKWKMGSLVTEAGYSPETIDAGYEWFGYHQTVLAEGKYVEPITNWWTTLYEDPDVCALVGIGNPGDSSFEDTEFIAEYSVSNVIGTEFIFWSIPSSERCR
jgi:hypothetical protein